MNKVCFAKAGTVQDFVWREQLISTLPGAVGGSIRFRRQASIPTNPPYNPELPPDPDSPIKPDIPNSPDEIPNESPPEIEEPVPDVIPVPVREPPRISRRATVCRTGPRT